MSLPCASIALFRHPDQPEKLWLAVWDSHANHFDFVTAERLERESWRECLDREIAWTLNLRRGKEYMISSMARLRLDLTAPTDSTEISSLNTSPGQSQYSAVEFYVVDLYGKSGEATLANNERLQWLSSEEVLSGRTANGRLVSPSLVSLLKQADVIARFKNPD
jgi:hypothetical protein